MVFTQNMIYLSDTFNIRIPESVLIKLEDGLRERKEMLITIDASHYGMRNSNWTVYRHDTVCNDINSFVLPAPKPIIERHRLKESDRFGDVIAADYKLTQYHDILLADSEIEEVTTEEYIAFCKDKILPLQRKDKNFNGLAYVEVIGRLNHEEGIKKVLDKEFLAVSIGAKPHRLICSECGQDQVKKICNHFGTKNNHTFMLAESLSYEELSFVRRGADPFGKVTRIHDGVREDLTFEREDCFVESNVDAIYIKDFFKETEGKTIVCMNNICTVINQEDNVMTKKKSTLGLQDEFAADKIKSIADSLGDVAGSLELADDLTDKQFALVQKTSEGLKRRFPICDELNIRLGFKLVDEAIDLTDVEKEKVVVTLTRAAKKLGIELQDAATAHADENTDTADTDQTDDTTTVASVTDQDDASDDTATTTEPEAPTLEKLLDSVKEALSSEEFKVETLQDYIGEPSSPTNVKTDPVEKIFDLLKWFASDIKWAGESLNSNMTTYLTDLGKEVISRDSLQETETKVTGLEAEVTTLKDELQSKEEEITLLDEQNRELNYQLRGALVDEIVAAREALGMIEDSVESEKAKFFKFNYDALVTYVGDTRKMKAKLNDAAPVNNTTEIKTIMNPTHTDSDDGADDAATDLNDGVDEDRELTFDEKVAVMKAFFKTRRF